MIFLIMSIILKVGEILISMLVFLKLIYNQLSNIGDNDKKYIFSLNIL